MAQKVWSLCVVETLSVKLAIDTTFGKSQTAKLTVAYATALIVVVAHGSITFKLKALLPVS